MTAFELLPENREYLKHNITLYLDPEPDFMKARVPMDGAQFDAVVMNPPFEKQADIDHVLHAYKMLKPGCFGAIGLPGKRNDPGCPCAWQERCRQSQEDY